jgi:hypothetical protein
MEQQRAGGAAQPGCGAMAILRAGGPVQVPFRPCCVAAILLAEAPPMLCPLREIQEPSLDPSTLEDSTPSRRALDPGVAS